MFSDFKKKYLVTNVPWYIYPFYIALHGVLGVLHFLWHALVYYTSNIVVEGPDYKGKRTPAVYMLWHEHSMTVFSGTFYSPQCEILNHPYWYMKHIHIALWFMGYRKLFLGSTGAGGRDAALRLTESLKQNKKAYTFINPDGPEGPYHSLRKGGFHIAKDTGLPIIAINFYCIGALRLWGWDRKYIPLPFGTIYIKYGPKRHVTAENFEAVRKQVFTDLTEPVLTPKHSESKQKTEIS